TKPTKTKSHDGLRIHLFPGLDPHSFNMAIDRSGRYFLCDYGVAPGQKTRVPISDLFVVYGHIGVGDQSDLHSDVPAICGNPSALGYSVCRICTSRPGDGFHRKGWLLADSYSILAVQRHFVDLYVYHRGDPPDDQNEFQFLEPEAAQTRCRIHRQEEFSFSGWFV